MSKLDYLKNIIAQIEEAFRLLENSVPIKPPELIRDKLKFRHKVQDEYLFIFLKGVRYVSLLNASFALLINGHAQEMGVLSRCMDETFEDAQLFIRHLGPDGGLSDRQTKMLAEFYQEEFEDESAGMLKNVARHRIPRDKIRAAIAEAPENPINPHDSIQIRSICYNTTSGYVHGAYPHIMELYGGLPPRYHTSGMLNTPRIDEWKSQFINDVYRGILMGQLASKRLGERPVHEFLMKVRKDMESVYPTIGGGDVKEILAGLKKKDKK